VLTIRSILVPIDFSTHAEAAVSFALDLAETCGAKLHFLHSCAFPRRTVTIYDVTFPEKLEREIFDAARRKLDALLAETRKRGIECDGELTLERPADAILRAARELPADSIVMGTRGIGGLRHALLGSVAEATVRKAACPVTTVHASEV
jgi:nucleotide-binding universal stress UspA family protein